MSMATALLQSLAPVQSEEDLTTLVVDNDLRTITIPKGITNIGVQNDDEVLHLNFKMPRYVGVTDLSEFTIRINYCNANGEGDVYTVNAPTVDQDIITFSWLIGPNATKYKGTVRFIICAVKFTADGYVDKEYNTTIATLPVLEGLETNTKAVSRYSDILEQWRRELFGTDGSGGSGGTSGPVSWNDLTDKPFGEAGEVLYEWNNETEYDEVVTGPNGITFIKISNEPISSEEIVGKYLRMQGVVDGEIVVYDGAIEANLLFMFSEEFYSVNIDLPFVFVLAESIEAAEISLTRGVWVQYDAAVADVIAKIQIMNAPTDIDESYIPDTIARIADVEAMAKSVSWKNLLDKPFEVGAVYEYDENTTYSNEDHIIAPVGGFFENSGTDNDGPPWYIRVSNDALPLERFIGSNLILTSRDGSSDLEGTIAKNNVTEITEGVYTFNGIIIVVNVDEYYNTGTTFTRGIYCGGGNKNYTYPFTHIQISVPTITIEEEIIPDTIARVSDVQDMIDTALGVIENGSY